MRFKNVQAAQPEPTKRYQQRGDDERVLHLRSRKALA